ncbi:MAG: hypothetical protein KF708_19635 [Pirellulales bacterium]|nr:hypothetical protein [Pirellulales bacterium]
MTMGRFEAAVVRWPEFWEPRHDADTPSEIEVIERVDTGTSLTSVTRWVRQFNRSALASPERRKWAVILTSVENQLPPREPPARSNREEIERLNRPGPSDGRYGLA